MWTGPGDPSELRSYTKEADGTVWVPCVCVYVCGWVGGWVGGLCTVLDLRCEVPLIPWARVPAKWWTTRS